MNNVNYFLLLRTTAAIGVLFAHSYELLLLPSPIRFLNLGIGEFSVYIFFVISGFFIFRSTQNSITVNDFLIKRALRIFPALFICVVVTFIVSAYVSDIQFSNFWKYQDNYYYLLNVTTVGNLQLYGVFDQNPYPYTVNGSLWTLKYELLCYVSMTLFVKLEKRFSLSILLLSLAVVTLFMVIHHELALSVNFLYLFGELFLFFVCGATLNFISSKNKYYRISLACSYFFALSIFYIYGYTKVANGLILAMALTAVGILYFKAVLGAYHKNKGNQLDISYGIYIYSFPIQQLIISKSNIANAGLIFLISLFLTIFVAVTSWYLVERPAISSYRRYK